MNSHDGSEWLTNREAARYLKVSSAFLNEDRCYRKHGIPFTRVGRHIRYNKSELDAFLLKRSVGGEK